MKIKTISFLILAMFVTSCNNQSQDLKLPSVFSDHMVLQQKGDVAQLARALDWQSRGRVFESRYLHQ